MVRLFAGSVSTPFVLFSILRIEIFSSFKSTGLEMFLSLNLREVGDALASVCDALEKSLCTMTILNRLNCLRKQQHRIK